MITFLSRSRTNQILIKSNFLFSTEPKYVWMHKAILANKIDAAISGNTYEDTKKIRKNALHQDVINIIK